ncbi:MAG: cation:proton antiporter [Gemmatimonadota bacterium]|jgi:Kef-type K+ transport system membrane component KefB
MAALRPGVTLVLLMGLTWLTFQAVDPSFGDGRLAIFVGFVLVSASAAGTVASAMGLPRITGFIVIGIAAGPSLLALLPTPAVDDLQLIDDFALALIAMLAGGELQLAALRPRARAIGVATLVVTGVVWLGVALAVAAVSPIVPFLADLSWTGLAAVALLLGVWAANSSPDLTVAVIEERRAEGPMTEILLGVTIVKDVVVIVLFTLTLALVTPLLDPAQPFSADALVTLAEELGGSLVLGAAMGWVFSQYLGGKNTDARSPFATFLFAYLMIVLVNQLHMELLLTGVAAGFVIENLSPAGEKMIQGIRAVAVVIFAFFFTVAGARLDLGAVTQFWLAASVLILVRAWLTRLGAQKGLTWSGASEHVVRYSWKGLISQGGVSLGLILILQEHFEAIGDDILALAMAVILGNILAGPILLAQALSAEETGTTDETEQTQDSGAAGAAGAMAEETSS